MEKEIGFESADDAIGKLVHGKNYMVFLSEYGWEEMEYYAKDYDATAPPLEYTHAFIFLPPNRDYEKAAENNKLTSAGVTFNWIVTKEEFREAKLGHILD